MLKNFIWGQTDPSTKHGSELNEGMSEAMSEGMSGWVSE